MMITDQTSVSEKALLSRDLLPRILARLGFDASPVPTFESLKAIYGAWCQRVPFDNVRKLIHIRAGNPGPLPGSTATDFFEGWLRFGTGGTCWAGAGAFHSLLTALGFKAARGIGTMLAAPDLPPNHGTVCVQFGSETYLVDCSILHGEPLPLDQRSGSLVTHPAWGIKCSKRQGKWFINWRPLHKVDGFECRLERFGASSEEFLTSYEQTRGWSPFNYQAAARINRNDRVLGIGFGKAVSIESDGRAVEKPFSTSERNRVLIEDVRISEEIVLQLPDDVPTPPPPGSRTAQEL